MRIFLRTFKNQHHVTLLHFTLLLVSSIYRSILLLTSLIFFLSRFFLLFHFFLIRFCHLSLYVLSSFSLLSLIFLSFSCSIVLKVIKSPGSLLEGDLNFHKLKRLADVHMCYKKGFTPFAKFTEER